MPYWPDIFLMQVMYVIGVIWTLCFFTFTIAAVIDAGINDLEDDDDKGASTARTDGSTSAKPDGK